MPEVHLWLDASLSKRRKPDGISVPLMPSVRSIPGDRVRVEIVREGLHRKQT